MAKISRVLVFHLTTPFIDCLQRRIENLIEHLQWSFFLGGEGGGGGGEGGAIFRSPFTGMAQVFNVLFRNMDSAKHHFGGFSHYMLFVK